MVYLIAFKVQIDYFAEMHNTWNSFDAILLIVCFAKGVTQ